jgi:hypothetical protein
MWPSELAYYVSKYSCSLPTQFAEHIKKSGGIIPNISQADLENISLDYYKTI